MNLVEHFTHEGIGIEVDRSLPGARVVGVLERLRVSRRLPQTVVVDNKPKFAGRTLDDWAYGRGVTLRLIRRGRPRMPTSRASTRNAVMDACTSTGF